MVDRRAILKKIAPVVGAAIVIGVLFPNSGSLIVNLATIASVPLPGVVGNLPDFAALTRQPGLTGLAGVFITSFAAVVTLGWSVKAFYARVLA
ncbi:hypothetical protein J2752_000476 [Halarchaeum rubridurum]|uniref:Uncharacterized protein n=1 Tax=Halarchaeum rubridurum TaxID=489911 RepID=A0A830FYU1_9EURY|nr:hypothetical protein [Halarchaeum rubridurum]MBP1953595.1 hypothetical protein [Halarchaeum rubridurum]GGM64093.1 hypothetical protein GCM10009017_12680 [Halarchaeum rubridurum]